MPFWKALRAMRRGMTIRGAEAKCRIPRMTLWRALHFQTEPKCAARRIAFTDEKEKAILDLILRCADRGFPLT